jgi:hypothetical protein
MHRKKAAYISLAGSVLLATATPADATHLDQFNFWLTTGHVGMQWQNCPLDKASGTSTNPYFQFSGTFLHNPKDPSKWGSCKAIGPFSSAAKFSKPPVWWIQTVINLHACDMASPPNCTFKDVLRACSLSFVDPARIVGIPGGPCGTTAGVGPGGCEVCAVDAP